MYKPAWARRRRHPSPNPSWQERVVERAVTEFRADAERAIADMKRYGHNGGTYNGSMTHYGKRLYDVDQLTTETAVYAWLHAHGYATRKAVPGDGTYFERSYKGTIPPLPDEQTPRKRFRHVGV